MIDASLEALLADAPTNWGRWGPADEVGCLNLLDPSEVLRGVGAVRQGRLFALQMTIGDPERALTYPGRQPAQHAVIQDRQSYVDGGAAPLPGGLEYADDAVALPLHGTTHVDALGHAWYGGRIWNGQPAETTNGGMSYASIMPIARRGIAGRGVLLDVAALRGRAALSPGETFNHEDLLACAYRQQTRIAAHDILLIHTGWPLTCQQTGPASLDDMNEPGLIYSPALVSWFLDMEIPAFITDTIANETTYHADGTTFALHAALMRNLGVIFTELADLEDLAADCAADGQYTFLYTSAPLKITSATGAPTNPLVIK